MNLRAANSEDEAFLWEAQYHAALLDSKQDPTAVVQGDPILARYVEGWGRIGDIGIIAEHDNKPVGAAWCRLFRKETPGWGWIDEEIPEISVAVLPEFRQKGIGTSLLTRLLEIAGQNYKAVSLAVRSTNPAFRLYLRLGFRVLPERNFLNRTGVLSHVMMQECDNFTLDHINGGTAHMPTNAEHQIAELEETLRLAMLDSNVEALDRLISPDLIFTNHLGQVFSKQDDLDLHRSGILKFQAIEPSEMRVKVGGELATVSVRAKLAGAFDGTPFIADLRYTRVWRRVADNEWQIWAGHSSAVQQPEPNAA
ncbi:MAG: GNAT family N-acetyltransferase [Methylococcaceae bacterium]|nr:GNAT family N-acetyltransferase [Methylococcaceae bacterium]